MANTIRTLVVGNGGRESSLAWRLAEESRVHAVMGHVNPTIAGWCRRPNGDYLVGDFLNPALVAAFAKEKAIDLAVVANDSAKPRGWLMPCWLQAFRRSGRPNERRRSNGTRSLRETCSRSISPNSTL